MPLDQVGTFRAKAIAADLGKTKNGTPQVAVRFAVVDGDATGEEITWYGYLSEKAFKRTVENLRHCGWEGDDLSDLSTVGEKDCRIEVGEEEYEGKIYFKVNWVNSLDGNGVSMANAMAPDEKKAFAAKMRGQVIAVSKPAPKAAPKPSDVAPPQGIDDLPF